MAPALVRQCEKQRPSRRSSRNKPLPEGWLRWFDEETSSYYYEDPEGKVTWSDPTGWGFGWLSFVGSEEEDDACAATVEHAFAEWCQTRQQQQQEKFFFEEDDDDDFFLDDDLDDDDDQKKKKTSLAHRKKKKKAQEEETVWLHVYDVKFRGAGLVNSLFRPLTMGGAYHTGIEVYGREWSFGATQQDDCGIFACSPKKCKPHTYRESVCLGATTRSEADVFHGLLKLAPFWWGRSYDLLRKNCNSFCIVFAGVLDVRTLPEWIHSLGDGAAEIDDRARRLFAAGGAAKNNNNGSFAAESDYSTEDDDEAAVVSNNRGKWRVDRYASLDVAKKRFADLPLRHASVLFVRRNGHWATTRTYGLPSGVANIKNRFLPHGVLRPLPLDGGPEEESGLEKKQKKINDSDNNTSSRDDDDDEELKEELKEEKKDQAEETTTESDRQTPPSSRRTTSATTPQQHLRRQKSITILRPHRPPLARTSLLLA